MFYHLKLIVSIYMIQGVTFEDKIDHFKFLTAITTKLENLDVQIYKHGFTESSPKSQVGGQGPTITKHLKLESTKTDTQQVQF